MDQNLLNEFVADSLEHLDAIEPMLLKMEKQGPQAGEQSINRVFRAVHSIKGSSGLVGIEGIRNLSHAMETLLMRFRDKEIEPEPKSISALLKAVDQLRFLISNAHQNPHAACNEQIEALQPFLAGSRHSQGPEPSAAWTPRAEAFTSAAGEKQPQSLDVRREVERIRALSGRAVKKESIERLKVLLVEDDKFAARLLTEKISAESEFEIVTADTLAQTRQTLEQSPDRFFVAILDLTLPDAPDGEVVDLVLGKKIPAIILTATFNDDVRQSLLAKKIVDYVIKGGSRDLDYVVHLLHRLCRNRRMKALVADDSRPQRRFVKELLEAQHFTVLEAEDGVSALEIIGQHQDVHLVITDYNMPRMDGVNLVARLRADHDKQGLSIIGASTEATGSLSARFLKSGADDFLAKPFSAEEFNCRVNQNLDLQHMIGEISRASKLDFLTRLPNRRHFFQEAGPIHKSAQKGELDIALGMMDLDHFKQINDTYGHMTGDEALKQFAAWLNETFQGLGLVARFGGEEFCALINGADPASALVMFNEFRKLTEKTEIIHGSLRLNLTVSIGVVATPGKSLDEMIKRADQMLYQAKNTGRNKVQLQP